jgi:hypothetical protein
MDPFSPTSGMNSNLTKLGFSPDGYVDISNLFKPKTNLGDIGKRH